MTVEHISINETPISTPPKFRESSRRQGINNARAGGTEAGEVGGEHQTPSMIGLFHFLTKL